MSRLEPCPKCHSTYRHIDSGRICCPECGFDWIEIDHLSETDYEVKDGNGRTLEKGDYVCLVKALKVKGTLSTVKVGTKEKVCRLVD